MGEMAEYYSDDFCDAADFGGDPPITPEGYDRLRRSVGLEPVQTGEEATEATAPWWESWPVPFSVLARDRVVRVVSPGTDREAQLCQGLFKIQGGAQEGRVHVRLGLDKGSVLALLEPRSCKCGCGLPCPVGQAYADVDFCRKREYIYFRPQLDLRGMDRAGADRAMLLVSEAVKAAKLGQQRATVDVRPVTHKAEVKADSRPSNRIRLDAATWQALREIQEFWGHENPTETVRKLIELGHRRMTERRKEEELHE
jgi:hypothetical protein